MQGLLVKRMVLSPFRYGYFAIQMWSHKVLRWAVPWCVISMFLLTGVLATDHALFALFLIAQVGGLVLALGPQVFPPLGAFTPLRILHYVGMVNLAVLHASLYVLMGTKMIAWEPTKRQAS